MQQWLGSGRPFAALIFCSSLTLFLLGCGGGGGNPNAVGNVASVSITPTAISMNAGDVLAVNVAALDANKKSVFNQTFAFSSSNPSIQISTTGLLCAGTWDSLTNPINCHAIALSAATPGATSTIHATVQGVTSNSVVVSVHLPITSLVINPASPACVKQGASISYTAQAFSGATDITASVGAFNWNIASTTVGTPASFFTSGSTATTNSVKAVLPGITQVSVSANTVNPVSGVPATFAECAITSLQISPQGTTVLSGAGKTQQFTATAVDSSGAAVSGETLTWTSSQPAAVTVNTSGLATAVAAGTSSIVASCAPASCNLGYNLPTFSNNAIATVPGSAPATTVYATCTTCTGLVPISTTTNAAGTVIALPESPVSLTVSSAGDKIYAGGPTQLTIVATASNTVTSRITNAPGAVLAVSPDGNSVITNGNGSNALLFNITAKTVTGLGIPSATAADFAPDGSKAYVVSGSSVFVVQPGVSPFAVNVGSTANDVSFAAGGPVAYFAASGMPFIQSCNNTITAGPAGAATPTLVKSLPDGSQIVGTDGSNIDAIALSSFSSSCPTTPAPNTFAAHALIIPTTPQQIIVTPDSAHAYVTGSLAGYLPSYDAVAQSTGQVTLANFGATTFTGGSLLDSSAVYVGGSDGKIHIINTSNGTETGSISLTFAPNLVVVKP